MMTAREVIALLDLHPHPEGGWYRETWRAEAGPGARATGTAIYYLLDVDSFSHWHRVDASEVWHWYSGAPLSLSVSSNGVDAEARVLGPELAAGQRPQIIVPPNWWQSATSLGAWTLCGCTVSPGFTFEGFEMAEPDWFPRPGNAIN